MRRLLDAGYSAFARWVRRTGYELRPLTSGPTTMAGALAHFAPRFDVKTIVDVGASNGSWTELALQHWPTAACLLVEAQREPHGPALARLKQRRPQVDYVLAAAGSRIGTIHFDASAPFGGCAYEGPAPGRDIEVPVTTLDHETQARELSGPYLVKLDTHGFEVPILDGAKRVLADTSLLVIEVYNFTINEGALRFPTMCQHLERSGFRPIGIADPMYRPRDGLLWQFDCFFARSDRREFELNAYA